MSPGHRFLVYWIQMSMILLFQRSTSRLLAEFEEGADRWRLVETPSPSVQLTLERLLQRMTSESRTQIMKVRDEAADRIQMVTTSVPWCSMEARAEAVEELARAGFALLTLHPHALPYWRVLRRLPLPPQHVLVLIGAVNALAPEEMDAWSAVWTEAGFPVIAAI